MNTKKLHWYKKYCRKELVRKSDKCAICGEPFENFKEITIDHIRPVSKGGAEHIDNYQIAHERCNRAKGNEWK